MGRMRVKITRIRANLARFARSANRICCSSLAFPPGAGRVALLSQALRQMLDGAFARRLGGGKNRRCFFIFPVLRISTILDQICSVPISLSVNAEEDESLSYNRFISDLVYLHLRRRANAPSSICRSACDSNATRRLRREGERRFANAIRGGSVATEIRADSRFFSSSCPLRRFPPLLDQICSAPISVSVNAKEDESLSYNRFISDLVYLHLRRRANAPSSI